MFRVFSFLIHKNPLFFWLRFELFTIFPFFHQAVKAACVLQGCTHFFSLLLHCLCSRFRHKSFVQHCSCFCQLIRLLVAFSDKLLKCDISFLSFFVRCALTCSLHFNRYLSSAFSFPSVTTSQIVTSPSCLLCAVRLDMLHFQKICRENKVVKLFPNLDPKVSIASFRIDAFSCYAPLPINNSFVVDVHFDGPITSLGRQRKAVSSTLSSRRCAGHQILLPLSHTFHARVPILHRNPTAPLTQPQAPSGQWQRGP